MTYTPVLHRRSVWEDPKRPVLPTAAQSAALGYSVPPAINWRRVDTVAIHYTAADDLIDGDPGEHAEDLPAYLRAIQRDYSTNRKPTPYSVGYNVAVDWLGGVWELRGWDLKCAANKGHNEHTWAVLVLVDGASPATDEQAAGIRWAIGRAEEEKASATSGLVIPFAIMGHGELAATDDDPTNGTACPGDGLLMQIHGGLFSPRYNPVHDPDPLPPIPPTLEVTADMLAAIWKNETTKEYALVIMGPGGVRMFGLPSKDVERVRGRFDLGADLPVTDELWSDIKTKALIDMRYDIKKGTPLPQ